MVDSDEATSYVEQQGQSMQGQSMQGQSMQGQSMQGTGVEAVHASSVRKSGRVLGGVQVVQGELRAASHLVNGTYVSHPYAGAALVGAELGGTRGTGEHVKLRIDAHAMDTSTTMISSAHPGHQSNSDVHLYKVTYQASDNTWRPLCNKRYETDANGNSYEAHDSEMAVMLQGVWRTSDGQYQWLVDHFTIACWEGTIAKCLRWGYKPWKWMTSKAGETVNLEKLHLACVRGAMADYCGNGMSHTINGTKIDVFDRYGFIEKVGEWNYLQGFSEESSFDPGGAGCVEKTRLASIGANCPVTGDWIPPDYAPGGWSKPTYRKSLPAFKRGERSACIGSQQLVMFDTSTYCHNPFVAGNRSTMPADCSACTAAVCSTMPTCCSVFWSNACVNQAKTLVACGAPIIIGPILTL